jgi:hypothetical protein
MEKKNPAAVALGRLGGAAKVPKGFSALTKEERKEVAMRGVETRRANARRSGKNAAKKTGAKP